MQKFHFPGSTGSVNRRAKKWMDAIRISPGFEKPLGSSATFVNDGGEQRSHGNLGCTAWKNLAQAGQLLAACLIAVLALLIILSTIVPLFVAVVLSGPATALLIWLLLWIQEQRYITALDRALPAAVGRLGAQLRSGSGIQPALEKTLNQ